MYSPNFIVEAMLKPETYPEPVSKIELIQTHISFVFLTENYVYKIKKPVNFGFLDFSSLKKRHLYCEKELQINKRLCPTLYLEVVSITNNSGILKMGGDGEAVEFAVKMRRLPQEQLMNKLLQKNKINDQIIDKLAAIIANFHTNAQTNPEINTFGRLETIQTNWTENFTQTQKYINQTIPQEDYDAIQQKINTFINKNPSLFEQRIADGRIRDCHGDLYSSNIFVADQIYIFDAIEFNDRFRYSDTASDVAFLAMDLDYQNHQALSAYFIKQYITYAKDAALSLMLPFYKCYRAYVRGKVVSFRLDDPNICAQDKVAATKEASAYFRLAAKYALGL
ncbi:MAG: phosphotransferase [Nitrososphaerota archaeon]|jgi:aminoglycoside phosphotransferase family enzyme|nr:phosphotransferase [Nitrososphaerota archaeon]